jgi:polyhydroxybutyrate depolymerase
MTGPVGGTRPSKSRNGVLGWVLACIGLPPLLVLIDAISFYRSNRTNGSLISAGIEREYLVYVPRSYDRTKPTPLVISMHGAAGWPTQQKNLSRWNRMADREGFVVAYPSGVHSTGPRIWHVDFGPGLERDVQFIKAMIDTLEARYHIDPTRIYADGMSNGGGMAFVLSCILSDRIAAVGIVASAQTLPWRWCKDRRPVPMIGFHGTADPDVPYQGGASWVSSEGFAGILDWTRNWARRNQCGANPIDSVVAPDVTRRWYPDCAENSEVVLYTIRGGGHTWPGGEPIPEWWVGPTSRNIDATALLWSFYREHPLVRR